MQRRPWRPDWAREPKPAEARSQSGVEVDGRSSPGGTARFRLLDMTPIVSKKPIESELRQARRRHAQHVHGLFASAEADCERLTKSEWLALYGEQLDNARAALEWCFAEDGDEPLGVALAVAAVPLWVQLSLMSECRDWASARWAGRRDPPMTPIECGFAQHSAGR